MAREDGEAGQAPGGQTKEEPLELSVDELSDRKEKRKPPGRGQPGPCLAVCLGGQSFFPLSLIPHL